MATIANAYDPDDSNNTNASGGTGTVTNPAAAGGGAAGASSASAYQRGGAPGGATGNPSGMPNVQDYLNANQGAGQKLQQGITNQYQNQANQYGQTLSNNQNQLNTQYNPLNQQTAGGQQAATTAFQDPQALLAAYQASQSQSATSNPNQAPVSAYGANGSQYSYNPASQAWTDSSGNATTFGQAFGTPMSQQQALTDYGNLQQNVAGTGAYNAQQQAINQYGTSGQQDYNQLQTQLGTLGQTANSAANQMGQNQLLQNAIGNPNYNTGQQTLDSLFLQGQGNQLQQNLGNIYNQANTNTQNFNQNNQAQLQALQQVAAGNATGTQNLFNTGNWAGTTPNQQGLSGIAQNVQSQLSAAQAAQPGQQAAIQSAAAANNGQGVFNSQQLSQLGLAPGTQAWGVGLGNYIQGPQNLTAAGVASPQEFARYQALNQLAGGNAGTAQPSIFGSATTAGNYSPVSFNNTGFNNAVSQAQQAITGTDLQNAIAGVQSNLGQNAQNELNQGQFGNNSVNTFLQQLQQGLSNGTLNPNAANTMIQNEIPSLENQVNSTLSTGNITNPSYGAWQSLYGAAHPADALQNAINSAFNPFTQYYNNQYLPAAGDILGGGAISTPSNAGLGQMGITGTASTGLPLGTSSTNFGTGGGQIV